MIQLIMGRGYYNQYNASSPEVTTHKLKGNKMITTTKVWKKKKYGYGFVSSRKTTYSCKYGSTTGQSVSTAKESDVGGGKPVLVEQECSNFLNHATDDRDTFGNVGRSESTGAIDR